MTLCHTWQTDFHQGHLLKRKSDPGTLLKRGDSIWRYLNRMREGYLLKPRNPFALSCYLGPSQVALPQDCDEDVFENRPFTSVIIFPSSFKWKVFSRQPLAAGLYWSILHAQHRLGPGELSTTPCRNLGGREQLREMGDLSFTGTQSCAWAVHALPGWPQRKKKLLAVRKLW